MEHTPIPPATTRSESIPDGLLYDARHAADALSGLPLANFGIARAVDVLSRFNTEQIGDAIEVLVALLDVAAGDNDIEANGDEEPNGTGEGDTSWTEWHTRGSHKDNPGVIGRMGYQLQEDMEDDDGDTGVEDGPLGFDPEEDCGAEERGELTSHESFTQGCGSAPHCDDDNEPRCVPVSMDSMKGFEAHFSP